MLIPITFKRPNKRDRFALICTACGCRWPPREYAPDRAKLDRSRDQHVCAMKGTGYDGFSAPPATATAASGPTTGSAHDGRS